MYQSKAQNIAAANLRAKRRSRSSCLHVSHIALLARLELDNQQLLEVLDDFHLSKVGRALILQLALAILRCFQPLQEFQDALRATVPMIRKQW